MNDNFEIRSRTGRRESQFNKTVRRVTLGKYYLLYISMPTRK